MFVQNILDFIKVPSVNIIMGKRGAGKSALAHYLLAELSCKYSLYPGIVGFPLDKKALLPSNYTIFHDFDFPGQHVIFIDEVSFYAHSRRSMNQANMVLDRIMSRARHMHWVIIIASHHASKIDIGLIRDADNLLYKEPSRLEVEYGSRTGIIQNIAKKAHKLFKDIEGEKRRYVYFVSEDKEQLCTNPMAHYWNEELSITTVLPINDSEFDNKVDTKTVSVLVPCYYCRQEAIGLCECCDNFVCTEHNHAPQRTIGIKNTHITKALRITERNELVRQLRKELRK